MKKKTLKRNPSNRKSITYFTDFRGGKLKCYRHTDIQTDIHAYRPSDEAGPRGAFAPKKSH